MLGSTGKLHSQASELRQEVEVIFFEYLYLNLVPLCKNISPKKELLYNLNAFLHFNVP